VGNSAALKRWEFRMFWRRKLIGNAKYFAFSLLLLSNVSLDANALDRVYAMPVLDDKDMRHEHNYELLVMALEASKDKYGPYKVSRSYRSISNDRILPELIKGEHLSVGVSMPKDEWQGKTNVVPFPILKGLASYRLFFCLSKNKGTLKNALSLQDLRRYKFGQGRGWSTVKILKDNGFKVVYGDSYSSMFKMLAADRYDFLMRGVYEISIERDIFSKTVPGLSVAEGVVIYTYLPLYFNVTKTQPQLAERLEYGLKKAYASGQTEVLFDKYFKPGIQWLKLRERKVFYMENTNLKKYPGLFERDKPYLLDFVSTSHQQAPQAPQPPQ